MANILVINGPNLNLLGSRDPAMYGTETLQAINLRLEDLCNELGHFFASVQSNHEGVLVDRVQECVLAGTNFIIFNPAAFTHTSIALRDALIAVNIPFIEVHLSNIFQRESFRQQSFFSDIAIGTITGLGAEGYALALRYAHSYLTSTKQELTRS
jgi:3-dehydroquinate dehydratase II